MLFLVWLVRRFDGHKFNPTVPSYKHKQQDVKRSQDTDETGNTCQCSVTDWTITGGMENPVPNAELHHICGAEDFPAGYVSQRPRLAQPRPGTVSFRLKG